jgi:hypothetical protein
MGDLLPTEPDAAGVPTGEISVADAMSGTTTKDNG